MVKKIIYINADVITMDEAAEPTRAFGVLGDRFTVVGSEEDVKQWGGIEAEIIDLKGQIVLPGLIETHNHLSFFSMHFDHANCSTPPNTRIAQVLALLKNQAQHSPKKEDWVFGWGFDDTLIEDNRHINRDELDDVSRDHCVVVIHTSSHLAYVNSRVLDILKIDDTTPDPPGGEIHRDTSGRATGLLKETAMFPIMELAPKLSVEQLKPLLEEGVAVANGNGVTTVHDGAIGMEGCGPEIVRALQELARENRLNVRYYLTLLYSFFDQLYELGICTGFGSDMVKIGSIKLIQDGSIQARTAWLSQPYHDMQDSGNRGKPIMPQKELDELISKYHEADLQIAVHANGDAAIESVISAVEKAQKKCPRKDPRHLLIHCQTVKENQILRMLACGLMPSFFVQHIYYWGDRHRDIFLGSERAARMNPLALSIKHGLEFTLHSDLPITPMEPLHSMHTAVNRITRNGRKLGIEECITPMDALKAYTTWAARAGFEEDIKGSITPGKLADWVVVSDNPLTISPEKIKDIKVLKTIVGGKTVYNRQN